jgi:hypothetical protein
MRPSALAYRLGGGLAVQILAHHYHRAARVIRDPLGDAPHEKALQPAELSAKPLVAYDYEPATISSLTRSISSSGLPTRR